MGPQHSSGIFHPSLGFLINCDLVSLEARILKCRIQTSSSLLTSRQIQTTMGFTDTQIYLLLKLFDYQLLNKVSSLDLFGAMALSSSDDLESKFRFLFRLMDQNRDNFLSSSDVETLFICVSRGTV